MKKNSAFLEAIGGLFVGLITIAVSATFGAFVGFKLYNWFLLPLGAPAFTIGQIYGAVFFLHYLLPKWQKAEKEKEDESYIQKLVRAFATGVATNGIALGAGWITHAIIY